MKNCLICLIWPFHVRLLILCVIQCRYLSERDTADRNFALGYYMRENGCFPENTNLIQTLEFYFQVDISYVGKWNNDNIDIPDYCFDLIYISWPYCTCNKLWIWWKRTKNRNKNILVQFETYTTSRRNIVV